MLDDYTDPTPVSSFRWTFWIMAATVLGLGGWDLYVAFSAPEGDTISEVSLWLSQRHPLLVLVVGIIVGHLFWAQRIPSDKAIPADNPEGEPVKIDWKKFEGFVEDKVIEAGGLKVPGADKADTVKKAAIEWLDKAIEPKNPLAEAATDIAIRTLAAIVSGLVQKKYEDAKAKGLVQ